jgi:hypothetical protein
MKKLALALFWTLLFAAAYAQSPLYTSNQNQYFLHGLANAGVGFLREDWLARTPDTVPVFNWLVEWTVRIFHSNLLFYVYYALLMGVYLFSLLGIGDRLFNISKDRVHRWLFLAALIALHSAALRYLISKVAGVDWAYVLEDGFAGQRMLGPVLEPSVFGVFLVFAVYLFLSRRPYLAALAVAAAAVFHPTYALTAALLTAGFMAGLYLETRRLKQPLVTGFLALAAVSPVLVYSFVNFWGSSPQTSVQAQQILVEFRIPHHAVISQWFSAPDLVKIFMIAAALWLVRRTRLFTVMLTVTLGCAFLIFLQAVTSSNTLALLFPWRSTVLLVPLALAMLVAALVNALLDHSWLSRPALHKWLNLASLAAVLLSAAAGVLRFSIDLNRKQADPASGLYAYVAGHLASGQVYVTPLKMQDFRLATGAPAYVDFKSIPYSDVDVIQWYSRVLMTSEFYQDDSCQALDKLRQKAAEGNVSLTHVVIEAPQAGLNCPGVTRVYQDKHYQLYLLP